jgi:hypothetical protein
MHRWLHRYVPGLPALRIWYYTRKLRSWPKCFVWMERATPKNAPIYMRSGLLCAGVADEDRGLSVGQTAPSGLCWHCEYTFQRNRIYMAIEDRVQRRLQRQWDRMMTRLESTATRDILR